MERIGRYDIQRELGRGCAGVVYQAFDPRVRREVAVKTIELPQGLTEAARAEVGERFLREAQAAGNLSHPSIVSIHDADEDLDTGKPFIVMEFVEGGNLRDRLETGPMERSAVAELGRTMADALATAHRAGIVHRDIKPANILLPASGGPAKLADFGVAHLDGSELTRSGATVGSPAYMAPEQVAGREVDGRSDLFSLAAVLYEALTGAKPFPGNDLPAVLYAVVHTDPVPPSRIRSGLPVAVDRFFRKALAKTPESRFQDAKDFRNGLDAAFLDRPPAPATAPAPPAGPGVSFKRPRSRPWWLLPAMLPLLAIVWHFAGGGAGAKLQVRVHSIVEAGRLDLLVDGKKVWSRKLDAPAPETKRRKLMRKLLRTGQQRFQREIGVGKGRHTVTARLWDRTAGARFEDSKEIEFGERTVHRVQVFAGGPFGKEITLVASPGSP